MKKVGNIDVIDGFEPRAFEEKYVKNFKPVIIKGAAKNWPAYKKWSAEYFIKHIGNLSVRFKKSNTNLFPDPKAFKKIKSLPDEELGEFITQESTFSEYVKLLENKEKWFFLEGDDTCFYKNRQALDQLNVLANDFVLPAFIPKDDLITSGLWLSKKGTATSIHYDGNGCHNVNAQIQGSKRVVLCDPKEYNNLYMPSLTEGLLLYNFSRVNWQEIDLNKFPDVKNLQYFEGILEPGDKIFIPAFWFHYFEHLDDININLNFWWRPKEIQLNAVSLSWALGIASMYNPSKEDALPTDMLKKLEQVCLSWDNGRPF